MFINVNNYVDFLVVHKMTPEQFLYCYLVHLDRFDLLYKYLEQFKNFRKGDIEDLERRAYIYNFNPQGRSFIDNYIVTDKFTDAIFVDNEAGIEFWEQYPAFININGKQIPARNASKDFIVELYLKIIGNDKVKHTAIMRSLKYAKEHDMISFGIKKWLESEQWIAVEQYMSEHGENKSDYGFQI